MRATRFRARGARLSAVVSFAITGTSGGCPACPFCGGGGPTCCAAPKPTNVTLTITSTGTSGCACIGTQVLPFVPADGVWELLGVAVCSGTSMDFRFTCLFDGTFWYWTILVTCNALGTGVVSQFTSAPMLTKPDCCPIDVTISGTAANFFGACCGGTAPYILTFHVTAACP